MTVTIKNPLLFGPLSVRIGRWWFQWRSFSPVPLFLILGVLPPSFTLNTWGYLVVVIGIFSAEALRLWAVGYAGSRTRTRGDAVVELVHAGPYRLVRNPLYIANIFLYTICGILFGCSFFSSLIFIYSATQYYFIVAFEEEVLAQTFGESYHQYCSRVNRWIPDFFSSFQASSHTFNLQRALRSERGTFYSMVAMAVLFILKSVFY